MSAADVALFVNFYNTTAPSGLNTADHTNATAIGSTTALTNFLTGLSSGLQLRVLDAAPTKTSGTSTTIDQHGIDLRVWNASFVYAAGTTSKLIIEEVSAGSSDWDIGDQLVIDFGALNTNAARHLTVTSASGGSATYTNVTRATSDPCPAPASFVTTVQNDGTGKACVILSFSGITTSALLNFLRAYAAPRINSVNDGTVKIGQTCALAVSGFVPVSGTLDGVPVSSVSATAFTVPAYADGVVTPRYGLRTLSLSNAGATISASYSVYVLPTDGYEFVEIRDNSKDVPGNLRHYLPALAIDDQATLLKPDQFVPPITINTVDSDGTIRTDATSVQTIMVRSVSTGALAFHTITTFAESDDDGGLIAVALTARGLRAIGLTARTL